MIGCAAARLFLPDNDEDDHHNVVIYSCFPLYQTWAPRHLPKTLRREVYSNTCKLLGQSIPEFEWNVETPCFLNERYSPLVRGQAKNVGIPLKCLTARNLLSTIEYRYFEYGISLLSFHTGVPQSIVSSEFETFFFNYQHQLSAFYERSSDGGFLKESSSFITERELDQSTAAAFDKTCGLRRNSVPLSGFGSPRLGSTYSDNVFCIGTCSDSDVAKARQAGWTRVHFGDREIFYFLNFDHSCFSSLNHADINMCRELVDLATISSVAISDAAQETKSELLNLYTEEKVGEDLVEKIRDLRRLAYLLHFDSIPYSVVNWEQEEKLYSAIREVWGLDDLYSVTSESIRAATEELENAYTQKRLDIERKIGIIVSIISATALIGLCAQIVDFVFSPQLPGTGARISVVILSTISVVSVIALFLLRSRK